MIIYFTDNLNYYSGFSGNSPNITSNLTTSLLFDYIIEVVEGSMKEVILRDSPMTTHTIPKELNNHFYCFFIEKIIKIIPWGKF